MDRAKTLTQLPGGKYGSNMADALSQSLRVEGVRGGLYRGLPVAMVREASKNMFRIGLFAPILEGCTPTRTTTAPRPRGSASPRAPSPARSARWRVIPSTW